MIFSDSAPAAFCLSKYGTSQGRLKILSHERRLFLQLFDLYQNYKTDIKEHYLVKFVKT